MVTVIFQLNVFGLKVIEILHIRIQDEPRRCVSLRQAGELELQLFHMVFVNVRVIDDMREEPRPKTAHLRDHADERRVLGHVEGHAEPHISAALDEHTVQAAVIRNIPHGEEGAGIERHVRKVLHIPEIDHHAAALRVFFQHVKEGIDLMVLAELIAVGFPDGAVLAHPLIPHMAVPLLQLTHIIRLLLPDPEDLFHGCLEGERNFLRLSSPCHERGWGKE